MTDFAHAVNLLVGVAVFAFTQSHAVAQERTPHAAVSHQSQTIYHQPRSGTANSHYNYPEYTNEAATPNLWGNSAYDYVRQRQRQQQAVVIPTDANSAPPQYNHRPTHDYAYYNNNPQRTFPTYPQQQRPTQLPPPFYHREPQHRIGYQLTRNEAELLLPHYSLSGNAYGSPEESRIQANLHSAHFAQHFQRYLEKYPRRLQPQYISEFNEK